MIGYTFTPGPEAALAVFGPLVLSVLAIGRGEAPTWPRPVRVTVSRKWRPELDAMLAALHAAGAAAG